MSKTVISIGVVVLLVVAVAGLWWAGVLDGLTSKLNLNILQNEEMTEAPAPEPQEPQSELTTGNDASNEALEEDLGMLDAQLEGYSEASSELDASLEDEPVEQDSNF